MQLGRGSDSPTDVMHRVIIGNSTPFVRQTAIHTDTKKGAPYWMGRSQRKFGVGVFPGLPASRFLYSKPIHTPIISPPGCLLNFGVGVYYMCPQLLQTTQFGQVPLARCISVVMSFSLFVLFFVSTRRCLRHASAHSVLC